MFKQFSHHSPSGVDLPVPTRARVFSQSQIELFHQTIQDWAKLLRLGHWDIIGQIVRDRSHSGDYAAYINRSFHKLSAVLCVLDPIDWPSDIDWTQDHDISIVHELLHLWLDPIAGLEELPDMDPRTIAKEQAIEILSTLIVNLKREFDSIYASYLLEVSRPKQMVAKVDLERGDLITVRDSESTTIRPEVIVQVLSTLPPGFAIKSFENGLEVVFPSRNYRMCTSLVEVVTVIQNYLQETKEEKNGA